MGRFVIFIFRWVGVGVGAWDELVREVGMIGGGRG